MPKRKNWRTRKRPDFLLKGRNGTRSSRPRGWLKNGDLKKKRKRPL
jgi:hypothetical protein